MMWWASKWVWSIAVGCLLGIKSWTILYIFRVCLLCVIENIGIVVLLYLKIVTLKETNVNFQKWQSNYLFYSGKWTRGVEKWIPKPHQRNLNHRKVGVASSLFVFIFPSLNPYPFTPSSLINPTRAYLTMKFCVFKCGKTTQ